MNLITPKGTPSGRIGTYKISEKPYGPPFPGEARRRGTLVNAMFFRGNQRKIVLMLFEVRHRCF
jgi:hypothetical protein